MDQWIKEYTMCYLFYWVYLGIFGNGPVNKIGHFVLANSLTWLGVRLVLEQWFKHVLCVKYFSELISGSFGNELDNKKDTIC